MGNNGYGEGSWSDIGGSFQNLIPKDTVQIINHTVRNPGSLAKGESTGEQSWLSVTLCVLASPRVRTNPGRSPRAGLRCPRARKSPTGSSESRTSFHGLQSQEDPRLKPASDPGKPIFIAELHFHGVLL